MAVVVVPIWQIIQKISKYDVTIIESLNFTVEGLLLHAADNALHNQTLTPSDVEDLIWSTLDDDSCCLDVLDEWGIVQNPTQYPMALSQVVNIVMFMYNEILIILDYCEVSIYGNFNVNIERVTADSMLVTYSDAAL